MQGLHLTADLRGCFAHPSTPGACDAACAVMADPHALREVCLAAVRQAGLSAVGELFHRFPEAGGVTGVVLLMESHLAVHTWPELGAVTLDVYVCNFGADNTERAHALLDALLQHFQPQQIERHALQRGLASPSTS